MGRLSLAVLAVVMAAALVVLCACGGGGGGGGGGNGPAYIDGPNYVNPLSKATFTQVDKYTPATRWEWSVTGDGVIVGATDQKTVVVRATAGVNGGEYTVSLNTSRPGDWAAIITHDVTVRDYPRFKIVINNPTNFNPTSFYGNKGTLTLNLTGDNALGTTYHVSFYGATAHLPAQVPVTITLTKGPVAAINWWVEEDVYSKTVQVPLSGGGTVGAGGSVLDTGDNRPELVVTGPGDAGSVRFAAPGVRTMVINIVR